MLVTSRRILLWYVWRDHCCACITGCLFMVGLEMKSYATQCCAFWFFSGVFKTFLEETWLFSFSIYWIYSSSWGASLCSTSSDWYIGSARQWTFFGYRELSIIWLCWVVHNLSCCDFLSFEICASLQMLCFLYLNFDFAFMAAGTCCCSEIILAISLWNCWAVFHGVVCDMICNDVKKKHFLHKFVTVNSAHLAANDITTVTYESAVISMCSVAYP